MKQSAGGFFHQITPIGDYKGGKEFKVILRVPMEKGWIERVKFAVIKGREKQAYQMQHKENKNDYAVFETNVSLDTRAIYYYYFSFEANGKFQYIKMENKTGDTSITNEECWKMSVNFEAPDWAKGAVMYHIFVDRYRRGSKGSLETMKNRTIHQDWYEAPILGPDESGNWNVDFYGGDAKGIEDTINYIKSLGVDIIYLSPVVRSQSNHRYDTGDYEVVDPYFGTNNGLRSLCDSAHKNGIKVILDAVFNHTGNDSKYFNEFGNYSELGAFQSDNSIYYPFYRKFWDRGIRYFAFWWGMPNLPECDGNSEEWKNYILGVSGIIDRWFQEFDIDGLRLDVADELSDEFIEGIRTAVKRNKLDGFVLGEVWKNPMRMNRGYLESGKGMDSVMNYPLIDALIRYFKYSDVSKLEHVIREIMTEYPEDTINTLMNFTSTHDISRAIEIFSSNCFQMYGEWAWNLQNDSIDFVRNHRLSTSEYKYGRDVMEAYVITLTFFPGIVSIFYGDEVGLQGIGNLANRAPYPWKRRDKSLLKFFRTMGKIRKSEKFLKTAGLRILKIDGEQFVFERYNEEESILVAVSRTHVETNFAIPDKYKNGKLVFSIKYEENKLLPYGCVAVKAR